MRKILSLILITLTTNMFLVVKTDAARRTVKLRNRNITTLRDPRITRRLGARTRRVDLSNNLITSFDGIEDFPDTIEEIVLFNNQIADLNGLENAPANLKILDVQANSIINVLNFPNLSNLEKLLISFNPITDFDSAGFLQITGLKELSLTNLNLQDISFLQPLVSLENLELFSNNIENFDLSSLVNLKRLSLIQNNIGDNSVLVFPPNLEDLVLLFNNLSDIGRLNLPDSLISLDVTGNQITNDDLATFIPPSSLCNLELTANPIGFNASNLQVAQLQNLKVIDLERTQMGLVQTPMPASMRRLFLGDNQTQGFRRQTRQFYRTTNPDMRIRFKRRSSSRRARNKINALCGL